jgi:hypothetical protein
MVESDARGGSGRAWWERRYVCIGGLGEVVVAGCSFMLMAIEKYEVRYSLLVLASGIRFGWERA